MFRNFLLADRILRSLNHTQQANRLARTPRVICIRCGRRGIWPWRRVRRRWCGAGCSMRSGWGSRSCFPPPKWPMTPVRQPHSIQPSSPFGTTPPLPPSTTAVPNRPLTPLFPPTPRHPSSPSNSPRSKSVLPTATIRNTPHNTQLTIPRAAPGGPSGPALPGPPGASVHHSSINKSVTYLTLTTAAIKKQSF